MDLSGIPVLFGAFFAIVALLVLTIFTLVIIQFVRAGLRANAERLSNNAQPVQTVPAVVVNRREQLSGGGDTMVRTTHFVTFELTDGTRHEIRVEPQEYGLLAAADRGRLTHQGTRFQGFTRQRL